MAEQPLNTSIQILRRVRTQREGFRGDSIKNITNHLRRLVVVDPGYEYRTQFGTRAGGQTLTYTLPTNNGQSNQSTTTTLPTVTDFSAYMGQAAGGSTRGLPVTVGPQAWSDIKIVKSLSGIDFPLEIGSDKFIQEIPNGFYSDGTATSGNPGKIVSQNGSNTGDLFGAVHNTIVANTGATNITGAGANTVNESTASKM